jgi:hypothetical protein
MKYFKFMCQYLMDHLIHGNNGRITVILRAMKL